MLLYRSPFIPDDVYQAFRARACEFLPHPLPREPEEARYVAFDAEWRSLLLPDEPALLTDPRPPVLYVDSGGTGTEAVADAEALVDTFGKIGPVIAVGRSVEDLPEGADGRASIEEGDLNSAIASWSWRDAPVVIRLESGGQFWEILEATLSGVKPVKTEVVRKEGPWRNVEDVEFETLKWV